MLSNYILKKLLFEQIFINDMYGGANTKKWNTLEHNGVLFPPEYNSINIPLIYDDKEILLNPEAEEAATFYAKYIDTEYIRNNKFTKNFWKDFKKLLDPKLGITDITKCDFSKIRKYLDEQREKKLSKTKEEKEKIKEEQKEKEKKYTVALIDGKEQPVGNFRIEPPGIFLGRGCHPMIGRLKHRVKPEDVTINIGKESKVPEPNIPGKWGNVIHDKEVIWLASWKENISEKTKYVWLSDKSDFKAKSDLAKFELARKLKKKINEIKKINSDNMKSSNLKTKQLSTALYLIENLALRVGNEKSTDEADTVGVTSLRVEHIELLENNKIKLDFLGKDSVRYTNKVEVEDIVYNIIKELLSNKSKKEDIFDKITPSELNKYLQNFMEGLTSKVFRTMNASKLFQKELNKITTKIENMDINDKIALILDEFNKANAKVALLCNHQKNISKNFKDQLTRINQQIREVKKKKELLEEKKKIYKEKGKDVKNLRERIKKCDEKIKKYKSTKSLKMELKNVSLGTSKVNYIDPRITISFIKKHNIDINKILTSALQEKFKWAMDVDTNFTF